MAVPSEVFDVPGQTYGGVVHRWGKYVTARREKMWGWLVKYDLGDEFWMLEADVEKYVCDIPPRSLVQDDHSATDSEDDMTVEGFITRVRDAAPAPPSPTPPTQVDSSSSDNADSDDGGSSDNDGGSSDNDGGSSDNGDDGGSSDIVGDIVDADEGDAADSSSSSSSSSEEDLLVGLSRRMREGDVEQRMHEGVGAAPDFIMDPLADEM